VALVTAAGGLTVLGAAVNVGGALVVNSLARSREKKRIRALRASTATASQSLRASAPEQARPENLQTISKNASAPRVRHYGRVKVGGNVVFHRSHEGVSYRVIVHGHGEISGISGYYLNGDGVSVDPSGNVADARYFDGHPRVTIVSRPGTVPSYYYPELSQIWPEWTLSHRLDGLWTSLIIARSLSPEKHQGMYPIGEPELTAVAQTSRCYDPRVGWAVFTENIALAIADYVASSDGFNRPGAFDESDIAEQANICDQQVPLAAGGTEALYRIGGSYLLNDQPQEVLGRMLSACAGRVRLKPNGSVGLKVGVWRDPEFVLGYSDILEVQEVNTGPDLIDRYTELPARYTDQSLGFTEVDAESWRDNSRVLEDGEILTGPDEDLLMCPSHRQARQVMKITMERDNPRQQIQIACKPRALPAIYEDAIRLSVPHLGLVGDYEVVNYSLGLEHGLLMRVGLSLRLVDRSAFDLSISEQGGGQQLPNPFVPSGVPIPARMTASAAGIKVAKNSYAAGIGVSWEPPQSDALSPLLKYRETDGVWRVVPISSEASTASLSGLIDGQTYDVSVAFVTPGGAIGQAAVVSGVAASAVTEAPSAPTGLTVVDAGAGTARVSVVSSSSGAIWKTEIYRDGGQVHVAYVGPGSEVVFVDDCGSGSFVWTARSVNVSNINSVSDAGPVFATIA
jgi:hypothetical protein